MDILLVDDNTLMQQVLERYLGSLGYSLVLASRADEAIAQVQNAIPALILLDLNLPDGDGASTLESIRAIPGCQNIPAIAMSGMNEQDAGPLQGFSAFLEKPVDLDVLEQVVRTHTNGQQPQ